MNLHRSKKISAAARWLGAGLFTLILFSSVAALAEDRWLFAFDTSSAMKKRLPATETEIKGLLATSISGSLHEGDSVGVWTFDQKLHVREYPLTTWTPDNAADMTASLIAFLRSRNYSGDGSFAALQPSLGQVMADSGRLTVVIFCDGADEIHGTPYDDGINDTLKQTGAERKKSRQPFVLLLRTQHGKYVGSTVNFPPLPLNVPPFPAPPPVIKIVPASPPPPPKPVVAAPVAVVPSLIIVGTKISTDTNDVPAVSPALTNPAPVAPPKIIAPPAVVPPSNPPPAPAQATNVSPVKTNVVAAAPMTNTVAPTNSAAAAPAAPPDNAGRILIYVGVGLLAAAVGLVILLLTRGRRAPRGSLITSSMQDDQRPPEQK